MLRLLSNSNCLICSSFHETFGVGLIEAAYYGLCIISSNCEGPSEIVNSTNGILIKKNNIDLYVKAMNRIIEENNKFKSIKIKKDIITRYGKSSYLRQYKEIIQNLLEIWVII